MKYYYDLEFLEGKQDKRFFGVKYGETKNTIDLISIGIVCEDGREFYAISKDFNLKEAWNRYDLKHEQVSGDMRNKFPNGITKKVYWIRENVLMPIFFELAEREFHNIYFKDEWIYEGKVVDLEVFKSNKIWTSNFTWFKDLLKKYGKTNKQIAKEIYDFVNPDLGFHITAYNNYELKEGGRLDKHFTKHNVTSDGEYYFAQPELYGYYSSYDHVALCWLFGKMIDLPKGFPMYTFDLKQELDKSKYEDLSNTFIGSGLKSHPKYPKQSNEHNALSDAIFVKNLYQFLNSL